MRRGLVFTLMNMYFLLLLLTIYVSFVVIPQMPEHRTYFHARNVAAEYWWNSEFRGVPEANYTPSGGCIEIPQVVPYNEGLGKTYYDDLNEIAPLLLTRWCG